MSDNSSSNKRIAKNTVFLYIRMAIVLVVSLYTTRVVLQSLGVEDFGIYNVVCGFVAMFSFLNATLSSSINRFYNYELGQQNPLGITNVYNNALRIQGALALLVFILVEIIGVWYLNSKMVIPDTRLNVANWIFHFATISMVFTILQTPYIAAILAYERMNYYAVVSIIDVFLKLVIAIAVKFVAFDKLWFYGLLIMLIAVINFLLYYVYSKSQFKSLKFKKRIDKSQYRQMLSFSGWSLLNPLAYTGRSQGCNIVLNYFFGPIVNAAYAITNQVASAIDSLSMSVSVAARPQLIQSYSSGDLNRAIQLFYSSSKIMFVLLTMIIIPLINNMVFILELWLGNGNVPEYTSSFCIIILLVKMIDCLNPACTNLILATGHIKRYMIASSICIFAVIPLSIIALFFSGEPVILFLIMLFSVAFNQILSILILHKELSQISLLLYVKKLLLPCIALFIVDLILSRLLIDRNSIYAFMQGIVFSVFITVVIAYYVVLDSEEKSFLFRLIKVVKIHK